MPTRGDYLTLAVGALSAVALAYYYPWTVGVTTTPVLSAKSLSLDNISGIDLNSLNICKEKGLI